MKMEEYFLLILCAVMMTNCRLIEAQKTWWPQCLPGERWTADCHACHCDPDGFIECKAIEDCVLQDCYYPSSWYTKTEHCYCSSSKGGITCMPLKYQPEMNGKRCLIKNAEFYSDCTYCKCVDGITDCREILCHIIIGVCKPAESRVQSCYNCTCTRTMFQHCVPLKNCSQEKPGKCPALKSINRQNFIWCLLNLNHICLFDMECPGKKKCCNLNSCYLGCLDPENNSSTDIDGREE